MVFLENNIKFYEGSSVKLTGGYMKGRQTLNSTQTVKSVYDRFYDTGRIDAFKCDWHEGKENKPHYFWDSDVAKWIEGAAYILRTEKRPDLEEKIEWIIDEIEKNQKDDGYFNIFFQTTCPQSTFTEIGHHELYCCGHLIEASVAYYECTGKDRFLKLMCRYADLIDRVFRVEKSAGFNVPGHEEIELALVRLYHATKEKRYLELAKFFVDERGSKPVLWSGEYLAENNQNHLPPREQKKALGHCVRAVYFYSAMADIAREYGDEDLYNACCELFRDIYERKMYITGGIGSTYIGEAFTIPYDLPPLGAYTESCASIGLCFFARRMQEIDTSSKYADLIERILYNGFLSSTSLDGKAFFYENPLEIHPKLHHRNTSTVRKDRYPITQRLEVFGCSCCPPNIVRFVPCLADYIYSSKDDILYIHQFMDSELESDGTKVTMKTDFPVDGKVKISVSGKKFGKIAVRHPSWCENPVISCGEKVCEKDGYMFFDVTQGSEIDVEFDMTPYLVETSPKVNDVGGKSALCRGPIVYCMEGVDNGEEVSDIRIFENNDFEVQYQRTMSGIPEILANGEKKCESEFDNALYLRSDRVKYQSTKVKFIPYFAFANRGETDMVIFFSVK